jgi:hypothetical protein
MGRILAATSANMEIEDGIGDEYVALIINA